MERPSFFRPADDLDFMAPHDDFSEDEKIIAPRAARSMALAAKKRGLLAKPKAEPTKSQPARQLWADIMTDDEDNFPAWRPSKAAIPAAPAKQMESEKKTDALVWDPIGLCTSESAVTDLLYHKTGAKMTPGTGTIFDKWSWSTTATDSTDSPAEDLQTDDDDPTPKASHTVPLQELRAAQIPQQPMAAPQFPQFHQMHPAQRQPMPQPMQPMQQPMPLPMPQQMRAQQMLQTQRLTMLPMQMQPDVHAQQPGMVFAVPCPMSMGMGMLPMVMSTMGRQPAQAAQAVQEVRGQPAAQLARSPWEETMSNTAGPVMGKAHRFHQKNSSMGVLSSDARTFTKKQNKGRLSIVSENKVHFQGTVRYVLQFTEGELCSADGVGFILSSDLPCTRNIQKIISVFANRTGRICIRVHDEVVRCSQRVKELNVGDWLEVEADLVNQSVSFTVWPQDNSSPSFATVSFKDVLENARGRVNGVPRSPCGFLAVVIKHVGVSVQLGS